MCRQPVGMLRRSVVLFAGVEVEQSAELVGYFVKPDVWVKPVLTGLTVSLSHGNILVLANIIRGSQPSLLQPHISVIFNAMENPDVCHTAKVGSPVDGGVHLVCVLDFFIP